MAAAFLAMNEVFGYMFNVDPIELLEPAAYAQSAAPGDLFVFDDQLHLVRGTRQGAPANRAIAQGPSSAPRFDSNPFNPEGLPDEHGEAWVSGTPALAGLPITGETAHLVQFIKDVYLDSQVTVGLLSNVTAFTVNPEGEEPRPVRSVSEALRAELLTAAQTAAARNFVNQISGSTRMLAHGLLYGGKGNLEYIQEQIDEHQPDSFKGYNISNAAKVDSDPNSLMRQWASRRRRGGVSDLRADLTELGTIEGGEAWAEQPLRAQRGWRQAPPTPTVGIRGTCRRPSPTRPT